MIFALMESERTVERMAKEWIISESDLGCDGSYLSYDEIIRCKDCKWYSQFTSMTGKLLSEGRCEYHSTYFAEDDFCSRGERKNG